MELRAVRPFFLAALLGALALPGMANAADRVAPAIARRLHALFDAHREAGLRSRPGSATRVGDPRQGDRLTDASREAQAAEFAAARAMLTQAQKMRR